MQEVDSNHLVDSYNYHQLYDLQLELYNSLLLSVEHHTYTMKHISEDKLPQALFRQGRI